MLEFTLGTDPANLWDIANYQFEIRTPDGSRIHPSAWDELVEPGWEVTFQFFRDKQSDSEANADKSKEERTPKKDRDEGLKATVYEDKVSYMLRFLVLSSILQKPEFDYEQVLEAKPQLRQRGSKPMRLPIIQEIIKIVHQENAPRRRLQNRKLNDKLGLFPRPPSPKAGDESEEDTPVDPTALGPDDTIVSRGLVVHSPLLLNALRAIVRYTSYEAGAGAGDANEDDTETDADVFDKGEFQYPYRDLFLHKDDLRNYQKHHQVRERHNEEDNSACDRHIDALVEYLYHQDEIQLEQVEQRWQKKIPTTTFGSLWLLMKPGTDVYVKENGVYNAYVIEMVREKFSREYQTRCYMIDVWNLVFNGRVISRKGKTIAIPVFDGEREITGLPLYPERFHPESPEDQPSLRQRLIERGKKYVRLTRGPSYMAYSGQGQQLGMKSVGHSIKFSRIDGLTADPVRPGTSGSRFQEEKDYDKPWRSDGHRSL